MTVVSKLNFGRFVFGTAILGTLKMLKFPPKTKKGSEGRKCQNKIPNGFGLLAAAGMIYYLSFLSHWWRELAF